MDKCKDHIALPKAEAIAGLMSRCRLSPSVEKIPLTQALGRVAAEDMLSLNTLPNHLTSRMDGIAVHFRDFADGMPDTSDWKEGNQYVFCNTGISIAGDYDTAIRIEEVDFDEQGHLVLSYAPKEMGEMTRGIGSTVKQGDLLAARGDIITPLLMGELSMGGYREIPVVSRPVVAFIPTGSELVAPTDQVPEGKNVDSNSMMMYGKILQWGAEPLIYPILPDDPDRIISTLRDALEKADIVIINGGSSKGSDDFTVQALNAVGTVLSHMILSGPGAHTSCCVAHDGKPIVGIPGPAVGAESVADWFVKPLVDRYFGRPTAIPKIKAIYTGKTVPGHPGRISGIRRACVTHHDDGTVTVDALDFTDRAGINRANAFLAFRPEGIKHGELVEVELRWPYRMIAE